MSLSTDNRRQRRDIDRETNLPSEVKVYKLTEEELAKYNDIPIPRTTTGRKMKQSIVYFKGGYRG